ncbi:MAG: tRNA (adenosine(37)-N6)-threonylcarbamoyltransferase complex transferase subunit TsaD [Planctomycetota bacterium]|nr:tRNA (adenosine(37)-N6)-threonylcarbamoyltransferase complex transferase subunit TsaD [Planctomycetota bacterium]
MIILGLETSCDETAAAIVRDGRVVLSSVVASQNDIHAEYAGVVPELASRAHAERLVPVVRAALEEAGIGLGMIDAVAVGHRPGLIGSLLVGVSGAKALAWSLGRPLVGVDHVHAHLYAGVLHEPGERPATPADDLFPAVGLVVSGGHTSLYRLESWTGLTRVGATIDDAMGEAFDKAAAILGIPFPGGPHLDALAESPGADDRAADLPVSRLGRESLDFSFSGLKTALLYAAKGVPGERSKTPPPPALTDGRRRDLAASFRRAACDAALLKITRAFDHAPVPPRALLVGGGVAANRLLRRELTRFAAARGAALVIPPLHLCVDNAAMIAGLAHVLATSGRTSDLSLQAQPTTSC